MLSINLEQALDNAFKNTKREKHEYMTTGHLLLALLNEESVEEVLKQRNINADAVKSVLLIEVNNIASISGKYNQTQPTPKFQRILQRAVFKSQRDKKYDVTGKDVIEALASMEKVEVGNLLKMLNDGECCLDLMQEIEEANEKSSKSTNEDSLVASRVTIPLGIDVLISQAIEQCWKAFSHEERTVENLERKMLKDMNMAIQAFRDKLQRKDI